MDTANRIYVTYLPAEKKESSLVLTFRRHNFRKRNFDKTGAV